MKRSVESGGHDGRNSSSTRSREKFRLSSRQRLRPDRRRLEFQALGALHEVELQRDIFRCIERPGFGADSDQAVAQPSLQRTQRLPFQPIDRIAGRMRLGNDDARQLLAGIVVVADGAGEIELALAAAIDLRALRAERLEARVVGRGDRQVARLVRDIGGERQQVAILGRQPVGLLMLGAAEMDAGFQVDGAVAAAAGSPDSARRPPSCWPQQRRGSRRRTCRPRPRPCSRAGRRAGRTACRDWRCRRPASSAAPRPCPGSRSAACPPPAWAAA